MKKIPKPAFSDLKGCFVAGGEILSIVTKTPVNDYDIYPKSRKDALDILIELINERECFVVSYSDRAITLKQNTNMRGEERPTVQVMIFDTFESAEKIFEFFDFTVCMGAFDCDTQEFHFNENFWVDVASKTLVFNPKTKYPLNSLLRIHKYNKKGFILPKTQAIKIGLTLSNTKMPSTWEELESAIGGAYGRELKLAVGDLECNYDNIMQVMDDMVSDNLEIYERPFEDDLQLLNMFQKSKEEKIELAYKFIMKEKIDVIKIKDEYRYYNPETKFIGDVLYYLTDKMDNNVVVHENVEFIGYKYVSYQDGKFLPMHYKKSEIKEYNDGETIEAKNYPYIYVFTDKMKQYKNSNNCCEMIVSYNSNDIEKIEYNFKQLTAKKIKILSIAHSDANGEEESYKQSQIKYSSNHINDEDDYDDEDDE